MRIMKYLLPLMCIVISGWATSGNAEEATETKAPKNCLYLMSIDKLDIIDDRNIAFLMNDGKYYLNHLPKKCPNLDQDVAIMYKTSLNSLCSLDIIDVLDYIGGGFQYYGSCGLGKFKPASREEIQRKLDQAKEKKTAR